MSLKKIVTKNLEDNAITEPKLAAGSVTGAKLSTDFITGQTELTSVAEDDKLVIYDASAGTLKKVNKSYTTSLTSPTFTSVSPDNVQTVDGGTVTFTITGSGFTTGTNARLIGNLGQRLNFTTVTRNSTTQITATIARSSMLLAQSPYGIQVINGEGLATVAASQVEVDTTPIFQTASGTLGSVIEEGSFSATVEAHDPDSTSPVNFEIVSGSLPSGITLTNNNNDTCTISGTAPTVSSDTTYNFTLRAYDSASNYNDRAFSITVEDFALNGLRFNSGSSDYLNKTQASGNRRTWTFSGWIKRSNISAEQHIWSSNNGSNYSTLGFQGGVNDLYYYDYSGASVNYFYTSQLFRDPSAWYNIVFAYDSTQATSSNRMKLYVNGSQVTSFSSSSYPSLNYDSFANVSGYVAYIGTQTSGGSYYSGYMSEINFIDGSALTPSSFGQTDATSGIWVPKKYSGSYGTNGFHLDFADSADLGNDVSGNNNDFTENNITSIDKVSDTPQNNFATLNPLVGATSSTFSNGNLRGTIPPINGSVVANIAVNTGKWYCEFKFNTIDGYSVVGISDMSKKGWNSTQESNAQAAYYKGDPNEFAEIGTLFTEGTTSGTSFTVTTGNIYGLMWDADNSILKLTDGTNTIQCGFTVNDTSTPISFMFAISSGSVTGDVEVNFGNPPFSIASGNSDANGFGNFEYSVPAGYYALCTNNLAEFG